MAGVRLEFAQFGHFDYFNIYRNSVSTAIENLGQPIGTSSTMYYEDLTVEPNRDYYYRAGVIRDSVENFSEEFHVKTLIEFDPPYDLVVEFKNDETNRLELNWKLDGFVDEQRYYCSETAIDPLNLPPHKAILASDVRAYVDTAIESGKAYYTCLSSVKNSEEKLSNQIKRYAIAKNLFKINSDFIADLTDKAGVIWTAHSNASVNNSALVLDGDGDYLTCSASDNMHFTNSEDVTIRAKIKVSQFKPSNIAVIFSTWNNTTSNGYDIRLTLSGIMMVFWNISFYPTFSYSIPIGVEFELSIERRNMVWNAYINGEKIGSSVLQSSNYSRVNPSLFYLGTGVYEGYGTDRDLNGTMRDFQLIKGLAVGGGQSTTQRI